MNTERLNVCHQQAVRLHTMYNAELIRCHVSIGLRAWCASQKDERQRNGVACPRGAGSD